MDEATEEIIEDSQQREEKLEPLEVKIVKEEVKKEYDHLDHDDEEYIEGYITDEEIAEFDKDSNTPSK